MSHGAGPPVWWVRLLLLLYPRSFRQRYGQEMADLARWRLDRVRRWNGYWERVRNVARVAGDLAVGGLKERMGREDGVDVARAGPDAGQRTAKGGENAMGRMVHDLTDAARRLARAPLFTLGAVAIVALGIGANTAVFTLVDALLFRPPPYDDPERVVSVYQDSDDGEPSSSSFPAYRDMAALTDVFQSVAAMTPTTLTWEADGGPRRVVGEYVTSSYLDVLGMQPSYGRWFDASHDRVGAGAFAVLSHHSWRGAFNADPAVVGRTIRLDGHPVTVIGVGPERLHGSSAPLVTDVWLSISSTVVGGAFRVQNLDRREDHWYDVRARLAPGVTVARAQAAMDALAGRLAEAYPEMNRGRGITVFGAGEVRIHPDADGELLAAGFVLMAVVLLVLLLACSNLANLLLVRGIARAPEVAVRRAMGASRSRVAGLFLTESLLLSALGGLTGLVVAWGALQVVPGLPLFPLGAVPALEMDHRVMFFTLGLVVLTGVAFGLVPAVRSARGNLTDALKDGSRSASAGRGTNLVRNGLVAVQVAVSLVLLVGAGLATRSLVRTQQVDPGVDPGRVAYLGTTLTGDPSPEEVGVQVSELTTRVAALPGVSAAAFTSRRPVEQGSSSTTVVEGYRPASGTVAVEVPLAIVGTDYFEAMGIPLVAGRTFGPDETRGTSTVVVVSEGAARRFWGGAAEAVGGRVRPQADSDAWREVIGVVGDVKVESLQEPRSSLVYYSAEQHPQASGYVVARTEGDPTALVAPLRRTLEAAVPGAPLDALGTLESHLGASLATARLAAAFLGAFSALAVLLACLGIYAVVSFTVLRRTGELGIRMALGAARGRVVRLVVREVLVVVGFGLLAGFGVAALVAPRLESVLFGVPGLDPVSLGLSAALLVAVSALASWIPARRAAFSDPAATLRSA